MPMEPKYVGFDWAMKRQLRNKANHAVIEGLLSSLIGRDFHIVRFLESEGNQEGELDKFNRVDMLAESDDGSLTIVEIQSSHQLDYFHRMLYGVSKTITEYIVWATPTVKYARPIPSILFILSWGRAATTYITAPPTS